MRSLPTPIHVLLHSSVLFAGACAPALPEADAPAPYFTAVVTDYMERPQPVGRIPRRPVFILHNGPGTEDWPLYLLHSPLTEALVEDLRTPSLLKQHQVLALPLERSTHDGIQEVRPVGSLVPGERYTLAVPLNHNTRPYLAPDQPWALEVEVGPGPEFGSQLAQSLPAPEQTGVAPNLPHVTLVFDGPVSGCKTLQLRKLLDGTPVPSRTVKLPCAELDDDGHQCCRLALEKTLDVSTDYRVDISNLKDSHGAPPGPDALTFTTGPFPDTQARNPSIPLQPTPCAVAEKALDNFACLLASDHSLTLRTHLTEPALLNLTLNAQPPRSVHSLSQEGWGSVRLDGLASGQAWEATFTATTADGSHLSRSFGVQTLRELPKVTITEVRSDPLGAEPTQEYVELLNYGADAVDLAQLTLSDRQTEAGRYLSKSPRMLPPGTRVLLVADGYVPDDGLDSPTPPGTMLLHVGNSLANNGLANRGEALFLRDLNARRISASPAMKTSSGDCLRRRLQSPPRSAAPLDFSTGPCDPGK